MFLRSQLKHQPRLFHQLMYLLFLLKPLMGTCHWGDLFCKNYPRKEKEMQSMYLFEFNNNIKKIVKRIWKKLNILKNLSQTRVKVITKLSLISIVSTDEMMNFFNYGLNFSWFICNYFVISVHFVGLS